MVVCCRNRALGDDNGCFGFWSHSRGTKRFTRLLRPQRPQQCTRSIGLTSLPPTSLEPPEKNTMPCQQLEAELQSTPTGDVQFAQDGCAPQGFPRSDALRNKVEEEDCSKHVQDCMHAAKSPGIHHESLAHAMEVLCHARAAEDEAWREAEEAVLHLMRQAEQTAGEQDADLVKDGGQGEPPEAFQPNKGVADEPPMSVAFEQQQQHQQEQQEHQAAEKREVYQFPTKPTQQRTRGAGQLEMFTQKSKQIQRLRLHHKRTDHDTVTKEEDQTVSELYLGKTTKWRGLPETAEEGAVKHGRTRRAAWAVAAAATAAAAAAAFVLAEAKEGEMKQGSLEDRQPASPVESEASSGCGALKEKHLLTLSQADAAAVSACRDSWQANAVERRPRQRPGSRRLRTQTSHRHGPMPTHRPQAPAKVALHCYTLLFGCSACLEEKCC